MIPWTPIRKGRMAGQGGWQEQYRALRMTPAGAAALVCMAGGFFRRKKAGAKA